MKILIEQLKNFNNKLSKVDLFSPAIFFPFVLIIYNLFGNIFDQHRSDIFHLEKSTYPLIIVAAVTYYLVYYFVNKKNIMLPTISVSWFSKLFYIGIISLTLVGLLCYGYMVSTGQLGILDESIRRNIDPKLNFFSAFLWFGYLILVTEYITRKEINKKKSIAILLISAMVILGMVLLIGYRTNLFMIVFTLILFFHYQFKKFDFKVVVIILLLFSVGLSSFGYLRVVSEDKTIKFNQNPTEHVQLDKKTKKDIVKINRTPKWFRVITAEFVNGKVVLSRIVQYSEQEGTLKGQLHLSAIGTVLPGTNESPRSIVTDKVNSLSQNGILVTREGRTTTPSFLGQLFLDGGYILLVIGVGLVSLLLTTLYNNLKTTNENRYKISYAFLTTLMIISVHTGLLDIVFFIFFIAMILYSLTTRKSITYKEAD